MNFETTRLVIPRVLTGGTFLICFGMREFVGDIGSEQWPAIVEEFNMC